LNNVKFFWFSPCLKKEFTKKNYKFIYEKITSDKKYLKQPIGFRKYLERWNLVEYKEDSKYEKNFLEYKKIKKKDDLIDCIIISSELKLI
jgi:hypothetical protein